MPKTAFILLYLLCGNFILIGNSAKKCPKNPLSPTSSVSGMIVGVFVGTEKLVNGVMSYFYYLGENSVNQVLDVTSNLGGTVSNVVIKVQDFASGLMGGISGQLKTIYNASSGSIKALFDSIINMENSVQSFGYRQVEKFSDMVVEGKVTKNVVGVVKDPVKSISTVIDKTKESVSNLSSKIREQLGKVVNSVKTSGVPTDIKEILMAPAKGVKTFVAESKSAMQTVKNESSSRFSGYSSELKNGGVIDKLVAVASYPVGATMELWSFTLKISDAAMKSASVSTKDVVQPFLGPVLTERLGKLVMLPMDATEGFYKTTINFFNQIGGVISKVTEGGSVGTQINMVVKHPLTVAGNALNVTEEGIKGVSNTLLGEQITEQLANVVASSGDSLSKMAASMSSSMNDMISKLTSEPLKMTKNLWDTSKKTIEGASEALIGKDATAKVENLVGSPLSSISNMTASITGGGSVSTQIKTVFTQPLKIIGNFWQMTKDNTESASNILFGKGGTKMLKQLINSPFSELSKSISSLTGGFSANINVSTGGVTGALNSLLKAPVEVVKGTFNGLQRAEQSVMNGLKSFYNSLPLVGSDASVKVGVQVGGGKSGAGASAGGSTGS